MHITYRQQPSMTEHYGCGVFKEHLRHEGQIIVTTIFGICILNRVKTIFKGERKICKPCTTED